MWHKIITLLLAGVLVAGTSACGRLDSTATSSGESSVRAVLPVRFEGTPSPEFEELYTEVNNYSQAHPEDFGGAFMNYDYSAIFVWTANGQAWEDPGFERLRNELDPKGETIVHMGEGRSRSYLTDLKETISAQYGDDEQIADIAVDPMHNAVKVKIRYEEDAPSLDVHPLALEISAIAPEVVFQIEGSPITPA